MLIQADASQLEWRTILELSNDSVGLGEVLNDEDTHSNNQQAFELPSRLIAKIYLFRTIFRGSGWSFANDADFQHVSRDPQFWDDLNVKFFSKYNGIDSCHKRWAQLVMSGKPIVGPLGRQWTINIPRNRQGNLKCPWTTLTNYPVQGTGADVMAIARVVFYKRVKKLGIPCKFVSTVHDSIVVDIEPQYAQAICDLFHQVFDDLIPNIKRMFGYDWKVPMACEVKCGPDMKNMVKMKRLDK
jgi:DNA polymerase I